MIITMYFYFVESVCPNYWKEANDVYEALQSWFRINRIGEDKISSFYHKDIEPYKWKISTSDGKNINAASFATVLTKTVYALEGPHNDEVVRTNGLLLSVKGICSTHKCFIEKFFDGGLQCFTNAHIVYGPDGKEWSSVEQHAIIGSGIDGRTIIKGYIPAAIDKPTFTDVLNEKLVQYMAQQN